MDLLAIKSYVCYYTMEQMRSWKANFAALLIAETLAMMGFGLSGPIIPLFLEEDIGVTDPVKLKAWVGLIQSCAAIALAVFAPIWGHLADTFSRRAMLLRAMFGGTVVISLISFVTSPWQLLVLRIIQGCITGTIAAATVLTTGIAPAAQVAFALGLLQTGVAVGNSLGPLLGGVLSDFLGYRPAFFFTAVTLALAGVIVLKWVEEGIGPAPRDKNAKLRIIPDFKPITSSPLLITMMLLTFGVQAANTVATPMLPLFLKSLVQGTGGESAYIGSSTGMVLGIGAATTAIAAVLAGKFSTRIGYWRTLIFCLAAGTLMTIPQTFSDSLFQLAALRAASSFFIGATIPVINAIIAVNVEKRHQGTVYGLNSSVSSTGGALGPMIGSAVSMINYRAAFLASAFILGISAWGTVIWRKRTAAN